MIAIHLCAPNSAVGNPRRGYLIVLPGGDAVAFVDEGYLGDAAVRQAGYSHCPIVPDRFRIPPIEYRRLRKEYPGKRPS